MPSTRARLAGTTSEYVQYSSVFKRIAEDAARDSAFHVKGFVSIEGVDRHGTDLPPKAFDVATFMRNPQLWYNHELYPTSRGPAPIGTVEDMRVVTVQKAGEGLFDLIDAETGKTVDTISPDDYLVADKDVGLWVVAKVLEPDVISFIADGRLNAFSWAGSILRRPDGKVMRIDIREVSLVFLPANARALFTVGRDAMGEVKRYVYGSGVFHPLKEEAALSDSTDGPGYVFLLRSLAGQAHAIIPSVSPRSDAAAKALAVSYAAEVYTAVAFKNEWKSADGLPVYSILHVAEGDSDSSSLPGAFSALPAETPWPSNYVDALPDSAFAYVCSVDGSRHFPHRKHTGEVDAGQLRWAALAGPSSVFYDKALSTLRAAAASAGLTDLFKQADQSPLTPDEQSLLGVVEAAAMNSTEGGDDMEEVLKALKALGEKLDALDARVVAAEAARAVTPAAPAAPAAPAVTPVQAAAPAAPVEDESQKQLVTILTGLAEKVATFAARIEKMEAAPVQSRQVGDTDLPTAEAVQKALADMTPADRKKVELRALNRMTASMFSAGQG